LTGDQIDALRPGRPCVEHTA